MDFLVTSQQYGLPRHQSAVLTRSLPVTSMDSLLSSQQYGLPRPRYGLLVTSHQYGIPAQQLAVWTPSPVVWTSSSAEPYGLPQSAVWLPCSAV